MIPLLLGLGNALVTVLAFAKLRWLSATILILIQIPWTVWDLANHYYGFLVLVPLGFVPMGMMLWERRKARQLEEACADALMGWQDELHPGEPRLVPHLDALEEHKEHLRTFDGED